MSIIAKPHTFTANTEAKASEVNSDFDTIYNDYNGSISGANLSDSAITTAKIADSAVTTAKIAAGTILSADLDADLAKGWTLGLGAPNTVTYNGNRSYDIVYNSVDKTSTISNGMRLRTTNTVTAPTQCTSLNGTTQYYSKTSPAGMTFTDDFVAGAWVKLSNYTAALSQDIVTRYNGTSGFRLSLLFDGRIHLTGYNAGSSNYTRVVSYQSIPLNKWVHIAAQLDMSTAGVSTTTSYVMIDGVDIPVAKESSGTNPTALIQAGDLQIGAGNATSFLSGKLAQVFVSSAKITQANIKTLVSQGLTSSLITTHSIISAYSFSNSIADLNTTNANNLTANGSAVATATDSPFSLQADGTTAGTTDYAIVMKTAFSTNTTLTVQVPEGNTIPTSGGVSAVAYSSHKSPYGMPIDDGKFVVEVLILSNVSASGGLVTTIYNPGGMNISVPVGRWKLSGTIHKVTQPSSTIVATYTALSTSSSSYSNYKLVDIYYQTGLGASSINVHATNIQDTVATDAITPYYALVLSGVGLASNEALRGAVSTTVPEVSKITAECAYV